MSGWRHPFNDHGKSMILGCRRGFVKLLAARSGGEIVGGACVGPQAGELIHEIVVAMDRRMTAAQLAVGQQVEVKGVRGSDGVTLRALRVTLES